jgi:hypothetical protein
LRKKVKRLELENSSLTDQLKIEKVNQKKEVETILGRVFTPGQIKKLMNPEKKALSGLLKIFLVLFPSEVLLQKGIDIYVLVIIHYPDFQLSEHGLPHLI